MAILSRPKISPQQRLDLEDFNALLSALRTDAKLYTKQMLSSENLIVKGFQVSGTGLKDATIGMTDATLLIPQNSFDFSWFTSAPVEPDIVIPDSSLTDNARNYVELELCNQDGTPLTKAFWDPEANSGSGAEFNQIVNTVTDLRVNAVVSTGGFSGLPDRLPLAIIDTDVGGNIKIIFDRRSMMFRLARPNDINNQYTWGLKNEPVYTTVLTGVTGVFVAGEEITINTETARVVTGGTTNITFNVPTGINYSSGDTVTGVTSGATATLDSVTESFAGVDKSISTIKEMIDALMTEILLVKGTRFWWQNPTSSLNGLMQNFDSILVQDAIDASWSWSGTELSITDASVTPADADSLALLRRFGESTDLSLTRQDGTGGSVAIPIADEEVLFIKLPSLGTARIFSGVGSLDTNFQTESISTYESSDSKYWLAYRQGSMLYVRGYGEMETGESTPITDPDKETILAQIQAIQESANQDRQLKLIDGGTWSFNGISNELILSANAFVQVPGLTNGRNTVAAQTIALPNANSVAYVDINREPGVNDTLTVVVADADSVVDDNDRVIIARRVSAGVIVGTSSFLLKDGERLELDGALAEINRLLNQTKITEHESNTDQARILASEITQLDGTILSQVVGSFMLKFDGAVIDFTTGEVFESDGATPLGVDFTPESIPSGEYFWYGISLNPGALNALNQQLATVNVDLAANPNVSASNAPLPLLSGTIKLGWIQVQNNGGSIEVTQFRRLGPGTGAGSGGNGFIKVDYYDPISTTLPVGATVTIDGQSGVNGDLVLFGNLNTNNNRVYELGGVGSAITWTAVRVFNSQLDPEDGDAIIVLKGNAFQEQTPIFNGTKFLVNDVIRLFDDVSGNFWELGSIKTSALLNNATDNVFSVNVVGSENVIVNYSLIRGVNKETGQLMITSNGTDAEISRQTAFIGSLGVTFSVQVNAGDLELNYTTDNQGVDAVMKFYLHRWSNSAGGPTGVPSYSGSTSSTIPAAGVLGDVQYHGGSGDLEADPRFKWDSSKGVISLDGLEISSLKGPINIADNVVSPTTLFSYPVSSYNFAVIEYSIERGTNYRVGRILIANSNTTPAFSDDSVEVGSTGVSFTVSIGGGNVELNYLSTATGQTGELKYSIKQWA